MRHKSLIKSFFLTLILFTLAINSYADEEESWNKINKNPNLKSVSEYIDKYPNGNHIKEAKILHENFFWEDTKKWNYISQFENYINKFPNGKHIREAQALIYEKCKSKSELPIDTYLNSYDSRIKELSKNLGDLKKARDRLSAMLAGTSFIALLADSYEDDRIWSVCLENKASKGQKKNYEELNQLKDDLKIEFDKWSKGKK